MTGNIKTRDELLRELEVLRQHITELETSRTRLEHIEEELHQSEELHRITLGSISDTVCITDDSGNFTFISPNIEAVFGYSVEEVRRLGNISKLLGGIPIAPAEMETRKEVRNIEREIIDKAGKRRVILIDMKSVSIKDGSMLYSCHDITDPKRIQEELRRHRDHLEELVEERATELRISNEQLEQRNKLLSALSRVQTQFISEADPRLLFEQLLDELLSLTDSEYGFIGQVLHNSDGEPYLKTHAITNIAWSGRSNGLYGSDETTGMEFESLKTLIAAVMSSGKHIIAHDPTADFRGRDVSEGHPRLNAFLGLPLHNGKGLIGMVGIGNCPTGYDAALTEFLQPFLATCGSIIEAHRNIQQRRQVETELAKSERNYRSSIDSSPLGTSVVTKDGELVYANQAFLDIYGYDSIEELKSIPLKQRYTPQSYHEHRERRAKMQWGEPLLASYGLSIVRRDGEIRHLSVSWSGMRWDGERRFLVIYQDITERKRAEERLKESEERYRLLFERSSDAIFLVDGTTGRYLDGNDAAERLIGRPVTELKALTTDDLPLLGVVRQFQQLSVGEEAPDPGEVTFTLPDGTTRTALLSIARLNRRLFFGIARDITERKRAEEILRTNEASLTNAQRIARLGNWDWDIRNNTFQLSEEAYRILGLDTGALDEPYKVLSGIIHPDDRENAQKSVARALSEGRPYDHDYRIVRHNGSEAMVHVRGEVKYDESGAPVSAAGTIQDITELHDLERKVIEYQELNQVKTNLLSTVSHELRTPLSIIKGYATLLLDYDERLVNEEKHEYLESIDRATNRLTELVDHILDMSRLESGLLQLECAQTAIAKLAREAVAEARVRAPGHKIRLDMVKGLPKVNLDAKRIRQVLDNIIDNAVKYSPEKTEIAVSAERKDDKLVVSISDQGVGIPTKDLDRVFDRMFRVEQGLTPTVDGVGLGLAICKGLVEQHGGHIWMESEEGKGSTCSFALPIHKGGS
jgi:PAS domain S-box-containing protein